MTEIEWKVQKERLIDRFGLKNFTPEFSLLVAIECKGLPDWALRDIVNFLIGSRPANRPPLIQDFRDARLAWEKSEMEKNVAGAARMMREPARHEGLRTYLARHFPGCKSLNDAVEVRKLEIQIQRANDPNYEPMNDQKWMGHD